MKVAAIVASLATTVLAAAAKNGTEPLITKTLYQTQTYTITKCPITVTSCPASSVYTTVVTVAAFTTVCPATVTPTLPPLPPVTGAPPKSVPVYTVPASTPVYSLPLPVTTAYPIVSTPYVLPPMPSPSSLLTSPPRVVVAPPPPPATGTPIVPGTTYTAPVYTISTSAAAVPNPPYVTGTIGTVYPPSATSSYAPIATGAASKVGAGAIGAVAVAAAAMML